MDDTIKFKFKLLKYNTNIPSLKLNNLRKNVCSNNNEVGCVLVLPDDGKFYDFYIDFVKFFLKAILIYSIKNPAAL